MSDSGLARKLGIKAGMTVLVRDAPADVVSRLSDVPAGTTLMTTTGESVECVVAFVRCKADVAAAAPSVLDAVAEDGLVWFAYPKKSSGLKSDLSRDAGWEPVYAAGFDSVAQISIDETWTGFRFRAKHLVRRRPR